MFIYVTFKHTTLQSRVQGGAQEIEKPKKKKKVITANLSYFTYILLLF